MPADRRILGPLDTDTAPEEVANGRSAALSNVQMERGYATTVRGNVPVGEALTVLPGLSAVVGACHEAETNGVVWLQWNDAGLHRLVRWVPGQRTPEVLLTWAGLNLPSRRGLTHAVTLEGQLLFLDAAGAVRSLNLKRAAAGEYTADLLATDPYALHLVKQPPHAAPLASREINPSATDPRAQSNHVAKSAWQFAYQYEYADGERTPLSPFSQVLAPRISAAPLASNSPVTADPRNFIRISYPSGEPRISPLVRKVRLLVREADETVWRVAGTFTQGESYDFYGDTTGEVLTGAEATKLFEALPRRVGALTVAHSRPFVGNCWEGDAGTLLPGQLVAEARALASTDGAGTPIDVYQTTTAYNYTYIGSDGEERTEERYRVYQYHLTAGVYPDPGSTYETIVNRSGIWYPTEDKTVYTYAQVFEDFLPDETPNYNRVVEITPGVMGERNGPPPFGAEATFHERSDYPVAVAFFDAQGRTAGAEAMVNVYIPRKDYAAPQPMVIAWSLPPDVVPPDWATSYSILLGPNRRTSFFLQFVPDQLRQYRGEKADGTGPDLRPITENGFFFVKQVWVSLTALLGQGRGYVREAGDRLRFVQSDQAWADVEILEQRGEYLCLTPQVLNLFTTGGGFTPLGNEPIVEIYRPAPRLATQKLYERGASYPVDNAGTPDATLSVTRGVIEGDVLYQPVADVPEAMWPSTNQWGTWLDASHGRPIGLVSSTGQVHRAALVRFGGVKVTGTQLNGLSQWEALDQQQLPQEAGAVVALRLAAQGQTEGRTLVALQERGTETLYLGQAPLSASIREQRTQLLVSTDSVIGGTNQLNGGYGTRHPGSVVAINGRLFWWCADQGEVCRYAADGVNPLNTQKECRALGQELARTYAEAEVTAGYDPRTKEYVLCFGATETAPARTVRYSERAEGFAGDVEYLPEAVVGSSDTLYTLRGDQLWRHTDDAPRLTWYEQAYPARASVWANAANEVSKTWVSVVEETAGPLWEVVDATTPEGQSTRAAASRMERRPGKWYGPLLMDRHSPGFSGTDAARRALYEGIPLESTCVRATLECAHPTDAAKLVALSVQFIVNSGQTAP